MTKKKILALVLTLALLVTQFAMLGVSAEAAALSGRNDFVKGVAMHRPEGYEAYQEPYKAILEAKALGSSLIRIDAESDDFDADFAYIADKNGMNVMFVTSIDLTLSGKSSLTQEEYNAVYNKFYNKATALKDYNVYIQIDNELDNIYYKGSGLLTDGTDASRYNSVVGVALAINAANKAVKDANAANGSNIKTIVNFSYNHYGFLTALKNVKIDATSLLTTASSNYVTADWDIIGLDFYSNMADNVSYSSVLSDLKSNFNKKVIVCESNLTPESKKADGTINYAEDVKWFEEFIRACYADTNVLGFVAYELYDQPKREGTAFNKEAHFGLIDKDGNKKVTYNTLCALYGGSGVVADRNIPVKPELDFADVEISKDGISTAWPASYSKTRDRLVINLTESPLNLSEVSYFEFDLYIEDYEAFKAAVDGKRINFVLACSDVKTKTCVRFDIENQITKSGWNHILLKPGDRWSVDSGFTYTTIKWAMINFQDGGSGYNPIAGQKVAIANICGLKEEIDRTPAWPEYEHIKASREGKKDFWGKYTNTGSNFDFALDQPTNIKISDSDEIRYYDQVEFDIYIKDYDAFKAAAEGHDLHFRIGYYDKATSTSEAADMYLESKITHSGWNHVVLVWTKSGLKDYNNNEVTDRDYNGASTLNPKERPITYVKLYWNKNTSDTINDEFRNTYVRIANICFTLREIHREAPAWPEYEHTKVLKDTVRNYWGKDANNGNFLKTGLGNNDITGTDQVEFDVYINDYDSFVQAISNKNLGFRFGHGDHYVDLYFDKAQITKTGWNHITSIWVDKNTDSDTDRVSTTGNMNPETITWVKLFWNWADGSGEDSAMSVYTRLANVCFTKKEINRIPEWPEYEHIELLKNTEANYWGSTPGKTFIVENLGPLNVENTDQVEFDLFVENYDSYMQGLEGKDIFLRLSSPGSNYIDVKIDKDQITKSGWNHIKLVWVSKDVNPDSDRYSSNGTFNSENITWIKFHCNSGVQWNVTKKTRMANVCFTNSKADEEPTLQIPTDVMKDKFDFIGAELKTVEFDSEGISNTTYMNEAIDMSGDNMMIELDVYVENGSNTEITIDLFDSNENMAVYVYNGLTAGWNHIAFRSDDCTDGDGNATAIDFSDIIAFDFVGAANTEVTVSNFYAASYIDGDGTRDGKTDIIDLIRSNKVSLGSETKGNIVALDLVGGDYKVKAEDILALRRLLLS
ncbi:MAG: hypothetical protein IKT38_00315 [Clostridia bacterium]|nr:hypothetical protein [Clostridia bacterium]